MRKLASVQRPVKRKRPAKFRVKNRPSARFLIRKATLNGKYTSGLGLERALSYNAAPRWLKGRLLKQVEKIYIEAQLKNLKTGRKHQVDHEIPLYHWLVCGLHVPWNLRIIGKRANEMKSNHFQTIFYVRGKRVKAQ